MAPRQAGCGNEVKASRRYRREEAATLREFLERKHLGSAYLVYDGKEILKDGVVVVLPVTEFMRRLARVPESVAARAD